MPVNLSVKNVPDRVARALRERARRNHRSLQGELAAILEEAAFTRPITLAQLHQRIEALGLKTPAEATRMVREGRDGR